MNSDNPIILFDGVCNFCNYWVNFAIKKNKKNNLRFAPLQGETAKKLLSGFKISPSSLTSVVLIENDKVYTQSTAALKVCKHLVGGWKAGYALLFIPKFIRDFFYNIIARYRYKWFGKLDTCLVPTKELRGRFLE